MWMVHVGPQSFHVPFTFRLCGCVLVVNARQMVHVDGACWVLDVAYAMLRGAPHLLFLCPPEASCSCAPPPDLLFLWTPSCRMLCLGLCYAVAYAILHLPCPRAALIHLILVLLNLIISSFRGPVSFGQDTGKT